MHDLRFGSATSGWFVVMYLGAEDELHKYSNYPKSDWDADPENDPRWLAALGLCKRVNLLDDGLNPTYQWPEWKALRQSEKEKLLRKVPRS